MTRPGSPLSLLLAVVLLLLPLCCLSWVSNQLTPPDTSVLQAGATRGRILATVGQPIRSEVRDNHVVDTFVIRTGFRQFDVYTVRYGPGNVATTVGTFRTGSTRHADVPQ